MKVQKPNSKDYPNGMVIANADSVVWVGTECIVTGDDATVTEQELSE